MITPLNKVHQQARQGVIVRARSIFPCATSAIRTRDKGEGVWTGHYCIILLPYIHFLLRGYLMLTKTCRTWRCSNKKNCLPPPPRWGLLILYISTSTGGRADITVELAATMLFVHNEGFNQSMKTGVCVCVSVCTCAAPARPRVRIWLYIIRALRIGQVAMID